MGLIKVFWSPFETVGRHRHLLRVFVSREVKGRFAGTMGGILWTLISPLATIAVYLFIFSLVFRIQVTVEETGTGSFGIYFLSGFFPWLLFSEALSRSMGCLVENANLITKVVFPMELLPLSLILAAFTVHGMGMGLFLMFLFFKGYGHWTWIFLFLVLPLQLLFTWGLASFLSAATVFVRDIREIFAIVLMIWFFATPIIYPLSMVPGGFRPIILANPMTLFAGVYRDILLMNSVNWAWIPGAGIYALVSYCFGSWFFMRARPAFGDVL